MQRFYYRNSIADFLSDDPTIVLGLLTENNRFSLETTQRDAWLEQISILQRSLQGLSGTLYFEYSIPRMGKRIDVVALIGTVIFVLEFKVGKNTFSIADIDQAWDYALDLKNFHETSHSHTIAPVLIATQAIGINYDIVYSAHDDLTLLPIRCNADQLRDVIDSVCMFCENTEMIDSNKWEKGRYCPTPTIIEAATALYNNHSVTNISRNDAGAINIEKTSETIAQLIQQAKTQSHKIICFVTGVPGSGKTLVGLNIATTHFDKENELYSVYLSGNGPLVAVLREALVRDKVAREREQGRRLTKADARSEVKMFIQNVHNFRDDCLIEKKPPIEHVALFDEAQRAWNFEQTTSFMKRKRGKDDFSMSEPEFLISCLDRHEDWAVIVCLVGGGQEINTGEAGIGEWVRALQASFPEWDLYFSSKILDSEYRMDQVLKTLEGREGVFSLPDLHLSVSLRSFRAENVSLLIKQILDCEGQNAQCTLANLKQFPIVLTRDIAKAKKWLKEKARGSERYGMVVSSQAERLKPHAIDIRTPVDPVVWFLNGKDHVRSSYYLEDVATEFQVQGLELDWTCVIWDADFRYTDSGWVHKSFRGNKWQSIRKEERKVYLKNAYRVLLTRARQGMVIVVPPGDVEDITRNPDFYDPTYDYLKSIGFTIL